MDVHICGNQTLASVSISIDLYIIVFSLISFIIIVCVLEHIF